MKAAKKIWGIASTALVIIAVLLAAAMVGVRLIGIQTYTVLSGSMEPTYPVGALLYVKPVDCQALQVGDPITFLLDEHTPATHRIIEVIPDADDPAVIRFRTKGDNNDDPDGGSVHCQNVIGRPVFSVPYLGYAANFIHHPPGLYIAIGGAVLLLILMFVPDLLKDDPKSVRVFDAGSDGGTGQK